MTRVGQIYREKLVQNIKEGIESNSNIFLFNFSKLSVNQVNDLRKQLKDAGAKVHVSRNALAALALKELKHEKLAERLSGQTAFIWSDKDSAAISKILTKFSESFESVVLQGGLLDGKIIEKEDVKRLSELPSREVLLAQLLGTIQAPVSRLLGAFNAKSRELLSILKQYGEKKGGS